MLFLFSNLYKWHILQLFFQGGASEGSLVGVWHQPQPMVASAHGGAIVFGRLLTDCSEVFCSVAQPLLPLLTGRFTDGRKPPQKLSSLTYICISWCKELLVDGIYNDCDPSYFLALTTCYFVLSLNSSGKGNVLHETVTLQEKIMIVLLYQGSGGRKGCYSCRR